MANANVVIASRWTSIPGYEDANWMDSCPYYLKPHSGPSSTFVAVRTNERKLNCIFQPCKDHVLVYVESDRFKTININNPDWLQYTVHACTCDTCWSDDQCLIGLVLQSRITKFKPRS